MLSILLFLLLVSVQNLHGLMCYSNDSFYFSRNDFNWNNFSTILTNIRHQIISNTSSCHVRITIDYNNEQNNYITIKFGSPINSYQNTHIEFGSRINFFQNQIQSIVSYLDYTCSSGNLCDQIFLNKWPNQLLNASNNSLHTSLISLWKNSTICDSTKVTEQCSSYLCFILYEQLKNLSYGKSQCKDELSTNPVYIHIRTSTNSNTQLLIENNYKCMKNHCSGQMTYNSLLKQDYTIESMINNNENNSKGLHEIILLRTIIIVGILVIIGCIAYYIQCRKY